MSRVAIVFPYYRTRSPTEMLFPPLGAAFLAAQLRKLQIETRIFDCTFGTFNQLKQDLIAYQPDVVGLYSMVSQTTNTFKIAEMVRTHLPGCLLVAGGPLPTLYPTRYTQHFDLVFRGEANLSFPQFCHDLLAGSRSRQRLADLPLESYPGLFLQNADGMVDNSMIHYRENVINSFPLPDRSDFDHAAYHKIWLDKAGSTTTSIITTFGCPFNCDFCSKPVFGSLFRRRDLDLVFSEIDQIRSLGYESLWIADDTFTLDNSYLREFCGRMAGEQLAWSCLSRVTGITPELASEMKAAGCKRVYLGLETADQSTLELMNKKATVEAGINAVHRFVQAGIEVAAFFIVGYPGETTASIESTFKMALSLPLDYISFNVPYPLPGSELFERVSGLDDRDWNQENEVTFVYTSEFDSGWLKRRIGQTMQAFAEKHV